MQRCSRIGVAISAFTICGLIQLYVFPDGFLIIDNRFIWENDILTNQTVGNMESIPKNIVQTGKHGIPGLSQSFKKLNPNYSYTFFDDLQAKNFVHKHMSVEIINAYDKLPLGVLKADYFRYIAIYILGGVYSDGDTECLRPIDGWADNHKNIRFIVGVEAEGSVEKLGIARPLQLCQWTFASTPQHPILKRVIDKIAQQTKIFSKNKITMQIVFNWTGPGIWTDTVFDYIKETYNIEWTKFSKLKKSKLAGDVYVVPPAGFQPMAYSLGSKGRNDKEARIWHYFAGTWKHNMPKE